MVLAGGISAEREVSLRSGAAVQAALRTAGHTADLFDVTAISLPEGIDQYDVVFSVLHGTGGEDGAMQALLEAAGVAFVGSGAAASALCFDKWRYRQLLTAHDMPLAKGALVTAADFWEHELITLPFVLKPHNGGSSIDTFIVRDVSALPKAAIEQAFTRHPSMLLEQLIEGTEITVAVLGDNALPVIEIIPPTDGEFDYQNKYNGKTRELCPPQNIPLESQHIAQALAAQIHQLTGCLHYSRTDMIVTATGQPVVLETNTLPGMTDQSLLPKAAQTAGLDMSQLVDKLVRLAAKSSRLSS